MVTLAFLCFFCVFSRLLVFCLCSLGGRLVGGSPGRFLVSGARFGKRGGGVPLPHAGGGNGVRQRLKLGRGNTTLTLRTTYGSVLRGL